MIDVFINSFTDRFGHRFEGSIMVTKTSGDTRKRLTSGLTPHGYYIQINPAHTLPNDILHKYPLMSYVMNSDSYKTVCKTIDKNV